MEILQSIQHIMKKKYDLKITSDKCRSVHPACPCVYACGSESLCTEKDVSSAEHSMNWIYTCLFMPLYAMLGCTQRPPATADGRICNCLMLQRRTSTAQVHVPCKRNRQTHTVSNIFLYKQARKWLSSECWETSCFLIYTLEQLKATTRSV